MGVANPILFFKILLKKYERVTIRLDLRALAKKNKNNFVNDCNTTFTTNATPASACY